jgi:hypothetical protein
LKISTRDDRSRDPLYNQSKAYSELYRMLGWIHPQENSRLAFSFTFLGKHAHGVSRSPKSFVEECLLGIALPNFLVDSKGNYIQRPFACILRTAELLDRKISRDEIIAGPMSLKDDRNKVSFAAMVAFLRKARKVKGLLRKRLESISTDREITTTTMGNYTRFPLAVLAWTDWTSRQSVRQFGKIVEYRALTEKGIKAARDLNRFIDLRGSDLSNFNDRTITSLSKIAFYQMLERANFDITPALEEIRSLGQQLDKDGVLVAERKRTPILFSPFQELNPVVVRSIFPKAGKDGTRKKSVQSKPDVSSPAQAGINTTVSLISGDIDKGTHILKNVQNGSAALQIHLNGTVSNQGGNLDRTADYLLEHYRGAKKEVFYPLIADLLCLLDFPAEVSRAGVNYQRADVFINDPPVSIPIEVKSPTEELHISVKAIRQALENKIILQSRTPKSSTMPITTLAVGFYPPNSRAEVESLVADIKKAYGISIGVIDFRSLLILVLAKIIGGKVPNRKEFTELCGIINVTNFQTENSTLTS